MKKVIIIQNNTSTSGGVWSVNQSLANKFTSIGYQNYILCVRGNFDQNNNPYGVNVHVINENEPWEVLTKHECLEELKKGHIFKALKNLSANKKREKDISKIANYVKDFDPDYIICSHYQLLDGIPKEYLSKTIFTHHNSFSRVITNPSCLKTLNKYNGLITFCWLSNKTSKLATEYGLKNNYFIYNPVKFKCEEPANVLQNHRLICVTRLVPEKQIAKMVKIVENIFTARKFSSWSFDIFGTGVCEEEVRNAISNNDQIKLHPVSDAKTAFLTGSINLCTSDYEGFPMSILEASECGLPTVSLNYGESVNEQIINNQTGFVCETTKDFKDKLIYLMNDENKLANFSKNAKEYANKFNINNVIVNWQDMFNKIDRDNK